MINQGQFVEIENRYEEQFKTCIPEIYLFKNKKGTKNRKKLDAILNQLQCKVCYGIVNLDSGYSCLKCTSKICQNCFKDFQWSNLSKDKKTPCCQDGQLRDIKDSHVNIECFYEVLKFHCKIKGCESFMTYFEIVDPEQHNDCQKKKYKCTYCNKIIIGQGKLSHQIKCNQKPIACDYCQVMISPTAMESHLIRNCQKADQQRNKNVAIDSTFGPQNIGQDEQMESKFLQDRYVRNMDCLIGTGNNLQKRIKTDMTKSYSVNDNPLQNTNYPNICSICCQNKVIEGTSECSTCSSNIKPNKRSKKQSLKSSKENSNQLVLFGNQNKTFQAQNLEIKQMQDKIADLEVILKQKERMIQNKDRRMVEIMKNQGQAGNDKNEQGSSTYQQFCYMCEKDLFLLQNSTNQSSNKIYSFCSACIIQEIQLSQKIMTQLQIQKSQIDLQCEKFCKQNVKVSFKCGCVNFQQSQNESSMLIPHSQVVQALENMSESNSIIDVTESAKLKKDLKKVKIKTDCQSNTLNMQQQNADQEQIQQKRQKRSFLKQYQIEKQIKSQKILQSQDSIKLIDQIRPQKCEQITTYTTPKGQQNSNLRETRRTLKLKLKQLDEEEEKVQKPNGVIQNFQIEFEKQKNSNIQQQSENKEVEQNNQMMITPNKKTRNYQQKSSDIKSKTPIKIQITTRSPYTKGKLTTQKGALAKCIEKNNLKMSAMKEMEDLTLNTQQVEEQKKKRIQMVIPSSIDLEMNEDPIMTEFISDSMIM
ncbi:UNKNOWN [Stylonychia lemnae]|uniref:Uncharacterized protein n=1 Tax=Stylonychia lemnae TaxID=5949 RepID=A0A078AGE3_STYLE|nr:UNKNOWN [Stylonychia lemnae]|eukprot:CDW79903.1 UNKNOWN [Stylonychia lemnae]